jgi:hypothetical protein
MVFCTLETGIFRLISKGQLLVRIRQISSRIKHIFLNLGSQIQILWMKYLNSEKSTLFLFLNCEINSVYKVISVRIEEIEEAPPPLEEDREDLEIKSVSSRGDRGDRGDSGTPALDISQTKEQYIRVRFCVRIAVRFRA